MFCLEKENEIGVFRYFNQTGIETMPIGNCGFQAKYYTTPISKNKIYSLSSIAADEYKLPILHRHAESVAIGFYEKKSGSMKLPEANALYDSYNLLAVK